MFKRIVSIILACMLLIIMATVSFAVPREQIVEEIKANNEEITKEINELFPSKKQLTYDEQLEKLKQLSDELNVKLENCTKLDNDTFNDTDKKHEPAEKNISCKDCESIVTYVGRRFVLNQFCERVPLAEQTFDYVYAYRYVCNECNAQATYSSTLCTH